MMLTLNNLLSKVEVGVCWEWTGARNGYGYGLVGVGAGRHPKHAMVHRVMWELLVGVIPQGLVLDHLCLNRKCCNPDHLEPVTHAVNLTRGHTKNARKQTCAAGHRYSGTNSRGQRICHTCIARKMREYRRK